MKKITIKRILVPLLCAALVLALLPMSSFATAIQGFDVGTTDGIKVQALQGIALQDITGQGITGQDSLNNMQGALADGFYEKADPVLVVIGLLGSGGPIAMPTQATVDSDRIFATLSKLLEALGYDPATEGFADTNEDWQGNLMQLAANSGLLGGFDMKNLDDMENLDDFTFYSIATLLYNALGAVRVTYVNGEAVPTEVKLGQMYMGGVAAGAVMVACEDGALAGFGKTGPGKALFMLPDGRVMELDYTGGAENLGKTIEVADFLWSQTPTIPAAGLPFNIYTGKLPAYDPSDTDSYAMTVVAGGGNAPYTYGMTAKAPNTGLVSIDANGVITLSSGVSGNIELTVTVTDATGKQVTQNIVISEGSQIIVPGGDPSNPGVPVVLGAVTVAYTDGSGNTLTMLCPSLADALTFAGGVQSPGSVSGITLRGTINVNSGTHTVPFSFTVDNAGQLNVGSTAKIIFEGTLSIDGTLAIGGDVEMTRGATLEIDGNVVVGNTGALTLNNALGSNIMGSSGTLTIENGGELIIDQEITGVDNGGGDASTIIIENGGTVTDNTGNPSGNFYNDSTDALTTPGSVGTGNGETYEWSNSADGGVTPGWSGNPN